MVSVQFGGAPLKVGEEDYTLFRDSEYVPSATHCVLSHTNAMVSILAKIRGE